MRRSAWNANVTGGSPLETTTGGPETDLYFCPYSETRGNYFPCASFDAVTRFLTATYRPKRQRDRCERELVALHKAIGVHAERYPLSGASRFRDSGHDIDVYAFGKDAAPLIAECKARRNGQGFKQLEDWLADYDVLFLRRNHAEPMVMLRWPPWARLVRRE